MTRKESMIKVLRYKAEHIKTKIKPEFFNEVADVLEQEPCEDAVSREYLVEHIKACWNNGRPRYSPNLSELLSWIDDVPFVQSKPIECEDAISRADAVKVASGYCHPSNIAEELAKLPPVYPKPKTGHWFYDKSIENWRCSECNEVPKTMGYCGSANFMAKHFKFCNHCGVRMIEPQESEG